jgi:hypothetical protein
MRSVALRRHSYLLTLEVMRGENETYRGLMAKIQHSVNRSVGDEDPKVPLCEELLFKSFVTRTSSMAVKSVLNCKTLTSFVHLACLAIASNSDKYVNTSSFDLWSYGCSFNLTGTQWR